MSTTDEAQGSGILKKRLQAMDDFQIVRFFEAFGQELIAGTGVSLDELTARIPAPTRAVAGVSQLEQLTPEQAETVLDPATSAAMARRILLALADDETFAPLLEQALATYRDEELVADVVLAVGMVASVLLMTAATEVEGKIAGVKFKKRKVDPELVKAVVEPFANALARIAGK